MREIEVRKKRRKKEGIMKWIIGRKNKGKFRVILRIMQLYLKIQSNVKLFIKKKYFQFFIQL